MGMGWERRDAQNLHFAINNIDRRSLQQHNASPSCTVNEIKVMKGKGSV